MCSRPKWTENRYAEILNLRSDINVIAVSSQTNPDGEQKVLAQGALQSQKPFDRVMLQAALAPATASGILAGYGLELHKWTI